MKKLILLPAILFALTAHAQKSYTEWLKDCKEVTVTDSIFLDIPQEQPALADPLAVKAYLFPLYGMEDPKTDFAITGKMTSSPDYDILLLYKHKRYNDSLWFKDLLLCTMEKTGKLLHFELVARKSVDNKLGGGIASSWFYKGGDLIVTRTSFVKEHILHFLTHYQINNYGVVVAYPGRKAG